MIADYFNQSITIQRKTTTSNGFGGHVESWTDNLSIDGLIDQLSGQDKYIAGQYADSATHILICEAGYDITSTDRVVCDNRLYRILNVDNPMCMNRQFEITLAYEGVDQDGE